MIKNKKKCELCKLLLKLYKRLNRNFIYKKVENHQLRQINISQKLPLTFLN